MLNFVDNLLNRITMYRLMLYYLIVLVVAAMVLSGFNVLYYSTENIFYSLVILTFTCLVVNKIFSLIFRVPTNAESDYITALILCLIITPGSSVMFLVAAGAISQASKYILAYKGKHIFNPAAIAVVLTIVTIQQGASWWIGSVYLVPFVVIGGLLVARKTQRFDLVFSFLIVNLATVLLTSTANDPGLVLRRTLLDSALLYFSLVMLTEPMTMPATRPLRIAYGALIGILFGISFNIGPVFSSPELALVLGNIFAFIVSPKGRLTLILKSKIQAAAGMYEFVFEPNRKLNFRPGQYLDWTLGHKKNDLRGNRRFFTIASSPTENEMHLGIKVYENPSTFKKALLALNVGDKILAGQLAGDFTLPKDQNKKLVFIAGGIGITPFRSMLKYLIDRNEKRPITVFYSNKNESEVAFKDILDEAQSKLGIRTINIFTQVSGRLNQQMIEGEVPDYQDQTFYISGPRAMVVDFEKTLKFMGISRRQIKIDFFPGFV